MTETSLKSVGCMRFVRACALAGAVLLASMVGASAQYEADLQEARDRILGLFEKKVLSSRLYQDRNNCVTIEIEDVSEGMAQIAVREVGGDGCPADVSPDGGAVLDRFVANPVGDGFEFFWMNANGDTEPFANARKR